MFAESASRSVFLAGAAQAHGTQWPGGLVRPEPVLGNGLDAHLWAVSAGLTVGQTTPARPSHSAMRTGALKGGFVRAVQFCA